jgi:hypothetical protein
MMEVTINIIPGGLGNRKLIQRIAIWNESDLAEVSDYGFAISYPSNEYPDEMIPTGRDLAHDPDLCLVHGGITEHRRSDGALALLDKVLTYALHEEYKGV